MQVVIIAVVSLAVLLLIWKDLMAAFFDENHARSVGLNTSALKIVFAELENTKPVADLLEGNLTILAKRPDQPATV